MNKLINRKLGNLEYAWTLANEASNVIVVTILRLRNAPRPQVVQQAFNILQERQPLLNVFLVKHKGHYRFQEATEPASIAVQTINRIYDKQWQEVAEAEPGIRIDTSIAPMMRCTYLYNPKPNGDSELIFSCLHTIIDHTSGFNFTRQLLSLCGGLKKEDLFANNSKLSPLPSPENLFPPAYKGLRRTPSILSFMRHQIATEMRYQYQLRGKRRPPIHATSRNRFLTTYLPQDITTVLIRSSRQKKVPLNAVLHAAMLLAVAKHLYHGQTQSLQGLTFPNLRPYLTPPLSNENLGAYISLIRYITSPINAQSDFWELTHEINEAMYQAAKRGHKFSAVIMSKGFIKSMFRAKAFRMSTIALNYNGAINLEPHYGDMELLGLHGFVSNHFLGSEYAGRAQILFGQLQWDLIYLEADMDHTTAQNIATEMCNILKQVIDER